MLVTVGAKLCITHGFDVRQVKFEKGVVVCDIYNGFIG
jgi:hypothetical protein